ncbi:MAG: hypothetical protein CW338_12270 [Clostridiales bacterium]|nr:hypothetical protein [Clostridiales bacterium]
MPRMEMPELEAILLRDDDVIVTSPGISCLKEGLCPDHKQCVTDGECLKVDTPCGMDICPADGCSPDECVMDCVPVKCDPVCAADGCMPDL